MAALLKFGPLSGIRYAFSMVCAALRSNEPALNMA
jgi:hypothetical protein